MRTETEAASILFLDGNRVGRIVRVDFDCPETGTQPTVSIFVEPDSDEIIPDLCQIMEVGVLFEDEIRWWGMLGFIYKIEVLEDSVHFVFLHEGGALPEVI